MDEVVLVDFHFLFEPSSLSSLQAHLPVASSGPLLCNVFVGSLALILGS